MALTTDITKKTCRLCRVQCARSKEQRELDSVAYCLILRGAIDLQGSIEGRRDLAGGRLSSDRRALGNSTSGQCFTSLAFSADGAFLLAGGSTKYVCMYDVEEKVMLRRFQASLPAAFSVYLPVNDWGLPCTDLLQVICLVEVREYEDCPHL